jgi:hypothetical protein
MADFLSAAFAFPTVLFTALLIFFLLYAAATLLGGLDIHWLDGVLGIDHINDSVFEGSLSAVGVGGVPVTIFGGISAVFAWLLSFAGMKYLGGGLPMQVGIAASAGLLGLAIGAIAVRPLRSVFVTPPAPGRQQIVGKICTIRSLRVDDATGTAEVEDGGSGFIAEVRCFRVNELTRGSKAIVYDYDSEQGIYHVGPLDRSIAG